MARKRYNKGKRVDMRQGGRVALAKGRRPMEQEEVSIPPVKPVKKKPVKSRNPREFLQQQTGGRKGVGAPRTPEELEKLEKLSYVAGRGVQKQQQIKKDPAPAPKKVRPQATSISQPSMEAFNQAQQQSQQQYIPRHSEQDPVTGETLDNRSPADKFPKGPPVAETFNEAQQQAVSQAQQFQAQEEMVNQSVLNQPQISPVTGEEMDFEVPAIGANEDTTRLASFDPKQSEGKGGREGGPWWRRAGFNSKEEAIAAGWKNIGGVWTPPNTTDDDDDTTTTTDDDDTTTTDDDDTTTTDDDDTTTTTDDGQGNVTYDPNRVRDAIDWAASADPAYAQRVAEEQEKTRGIVQEAAEGKVPETAVIPDAEQVGFQRDAQGNLIKDEEGNPIPLASAETKQMAELTEAEAAEAKLPTDETVTTGISTAAEGPEKFDAATYQGKQVTEEVVFDPATGKINAEDTAELEEKALTYSASGVTFSQEQKDQGIIDRVVGTLDDAAKAKAAKVAGTTLPKVLRAKKQLRNAGLSEEDIAAIGNDPEDLEDRLMDFTAEQRGMVGNLPEEALVGKQIEGLLEGMENGEVPIWARPAVSAVNQMMAARGLDASTVGRDNLFNAVIQAAMPIASQNAQTIKESAMQQINIEAQAAQQDAQMAQQTALSNADKVFNLNMQQFSVDVQTELANKKFLQTVSMTEVNNEQQAVMQNAVNQTQLDVANLNTQERLAVQNAQAFLSMNMANLNNEQQGKVLKAQQEQQRLLSNQASTNASRQFNSASENQTNQFMTNLATQVELNNKQRMDAMEQFNANSENAKEARRVGIEADINKANAMMINDIEKFNSQQKFARDQWNTANAQAVEMSNVEWRRKANLANTAAQNAINQQNAQNAFGLSTQAMSMLWQEMRDQADYAFKASENEATRKTQLLATALGNEGAGSQENWASNIGSLLSSVNTAIYGSSVSTPATPGPG
tara:strand:- start:7629 stop:10514 length:2886 start_codon:yes stop_codon:yes gene_type:complete